MIIEQRIYLMLTISISLFFLLTYDPLTPVSRASNSVTPAKFNEIRTSYRHKGMTIDEVPKIMGFKETRIMNYAVSRLHRSYFWRRDLPDNKRKQIAAAFRNGRAVSKRCEGFPVDYCHQ